jgi:hypothetical protein
VRKIWFSVEVVLAAGLLFAIAPNAGQTQQTAPAFDPKKCNELQQQVDQIVSIWKSSALSDAEKMAKLVESVTQSLATMIGSAANDPEGAKTAKEFQDAIAQLLSKADPSGGKADKAVPDDAKRDMALLQERIKPYLFLMKLMCPELTIPELVSR